MGQETSLWHTALGTNTVWGIPFGFLVMVAIWNRYDDHIDEAARDLGANAARTFGEVTLPLVWTGIFGAFLFGFTLTWNDFDRTVLLVLDNTLPLQIVGLIQAAALRPDLYALGTATTLVSIAVIIAFLVVIGIRAKFRRTTVHRVEEELGLGAGIDAEAAEQVVGGNSGIEDRLAEPVPDALVPRVARLEVVRDRVHRRPADAVVAR